MTAWTEGRLAWVQSVPPDDLLAVIADVARESELDENLGDTGERADSVLWLATRGREGEEWGKAAESAERHGFSG